MNLPNFITIIRILLIPVFIDLLIYGFHEWAFAVFLTAALTDSLDGLIARQTNQRTRLGAYLDPMADKLLLSAAFLALAVLKFIPVWSAVIMVSRDMILVLGALILHLAEIRRDFRPTFLGKSTTAAQLCYITAALFVIALNGSAEVLLPLLWITTALTILSGLHYIYIGFRSLNYE